MCPSVLLDKTHSPLLVRRPHVPLQLNLPWMPRPACQAPSQLWTSQVLILLPHLSLGLSLSLQIQSSVTFSTRPSSPPDLIRVFLSVCPLCAFGALTADENELFV